MHARMVVWFTSLQAKKGVKKKNKIEVQKAAFNKLNDDEKNDLVSQEIELLQAEIEQVCGAGALEPGQIE